MEGIMPMLYQKLQKHVSVVVVTIALSTYLAFGSLAPETSFHSFFWTSGADETEQQGCYGNTRIDSYSKEAGGYLSTFWLSNYAWWQKLFTDTYINIAFTTKKTKPAAITRASGHFLESEWLTGFKRVGSDDFIRFYFPLYPQTKAFGAYDYFTVEVNDTLNLEFYGAGDSILVGSFVHKKPDERGAIRILGRNAIIIELTEANPLRIKSLRCNGAYKSLLNSYLQYDLDKFQKNKAWYGVSIIDTIPVLPKIVVHSVEVESTSPLTPNSTTNITWALNVPSDVDSCLLFASFDNKKTWNAIGKTNSAKTYTWTIPSKTSDSTYVKVTAYSKTGKTTSAISEVMAIMPGIGVNSVDIAGNSQLESDSTYAITWNLSTPSAVDSCRIAASYDNKQTWNTIGKTTRETSLAWTVPAIKSDSVYVQVTAYGNDGKMYSGFSSTLAILPEIVVRSLSINGTSPLKADSIYTINWDLNASTEINVCLLEVSFDNKHSWDIIGIADTGMSYKWTVPNVLSDSTYIKITAYCRDESKISQISPVVAIMPNISVTSLRVEGALPLQADSTYKIDWKLNFQLEVDSCQVTASYDNKLTWKSIGKIDSGCSYSWKAPAIKSDSTFFKVVAYGKDGQIAQMISDSSYKILPRISTGIGFYRDRKLPPSFRPVTSGKRLKVHYTLPKGASKITVSMFDLKGRCLSRLVPLSNRIAQQGSFLINKSINSGYYYIRFEAEFNNGTPPLAITKKWVNIH